MSGFEGKFTRTQAENSDAFLSKMGANVLMRKAAKMSTPTMTITKQEGGKIQASNYGRTGRGPDRVEIRKLSFIEHGTALSLQDKWDLKRKKLTPWVGVC